MQKPEYVESAAPEKVLRFIRQETVLDRTQLSRSTLYELIQLGKFPVPLKLCGGRINCWPESEIEEWMLAQLAERALATGNA